MSSSYTAKRERNAIKTLTKPQVSSAYKCAVTTNAPVTYISRGSVIRVENGKKTTVGKAGVFVDVNALVK